MAPGLKSAQATQCLLELVLQSERLTLKITPGQPEHAGMQGTYSATCSLEARGGLLS